MHTIRRIKSGETDLFRDIRLRSLRESPEAFVSNYESARERSWESWVEQAGASVSGSECCTVLALSGSIVVGIAALYQQDDGNCKSGEIIQMWVDPEYRDQRLGSQIVEHLLLWARMEGYTEILATIHVENAVVVNFYEKLGFELDQTATEKAPPRDLILRLELS